MRHFYAGILVLCAFPALVLTLVGCEPPKDQVFIVDCPGMDKKEVPGQGLQKVYDHIHIYSHNQSVAIVPVTCVVTAKVPGVQG